MYAKFGDDRLWNEKKALADRKSDNNTNKNKNDVGGHWDRSRGQKLLFLLTVYITSHIMNENNRRTVISNWSRLVSKVVIMELDIDLR